MCVCVSLSLFLQAAVKKINDTKRKRKKVPFRIFEEGENTLLKYMPDRGVSSPIIIMLKNGIHRDMIKNKDIQ